MIARNLEQQQAICAVLAEDRKNWHRMPTDSKFSTLEAVASVLEPLSVLLMLFQVRNVSLSLLSVHLSATLWMNVIMPLPMTVP